MLESDVKIDICIDCPAGRQRGLPAVDAVLTKTNLEKLSAPSRHVQAAQNYINRLESCYRASLKSHLSLETVEKFDSSQILCFI